MRPSTVPEPLVIAWYTMAFITPIFVETILIFRLAAVYPSQTCKTKYRNWIIGFPIFLKFVRFAIVVVLLKMWIGTNVANGIPVDTGLIGFVKFPYPKICWGLQLLDSRCAPLLQTNRKTFNTPSAFVRLYSFEDLTCTSRNMEAAARVSSVCPPLIIVATDQYSMLTQAHPQ